MKTDCQTKSNEATVEGPTSVIRALWGTSSTAATVQPLAKQQTARTKQGQSDVSLKDGSNNLPSSNRLGFKGSEIMNQSAQHMAAALSKGAEWNKGATEHLARAFHQSHSKMTTESQTTVRTAIQNLKAGTDVSTAYGNGKIVTYNTESFMFQVQLSFGTLFTMNVVKAKTENTKPATTLELNSSYENWEQARRHAVEEECSKLAIPFTEERMHKCFACLKEPTKKAKPALADASGKPLFPMLYKLRQTGQVAVVNARKSESPCLLCATVTCNRHSSEEFRKEGISVCQDCIKWLEYDFASAQLPQDLRQYVQHLVDLYQRVHLLLQYSSQFMIDTADSLEQTMKQHNHIGVGGSGAGLVSSVLGVAAACTILTPAGPPLLVASLVFGGSATAVQTGSEAYKYYGEPNQFANRILTLQGIAARILAIVRNMRDSKLLPYLDQATSNENQKADKCPEYISHQVNHASEMKESATKAGVRIGSNAATSASLLTQEATLTSRFVSRATTSAARTARFARFAGGALSAATLVLEAREMIKTIDQIKLGSPCEKAEALRNVYSNLSSMPSTLYVKTMCESYSKVRSKELFEAAFADLNDQVEPLEPVVHASILEVVSSNLTGKNGHGTVVESQPKTTTNPTKKLIRVTNLVDEGDLLLAEEVVAGLEAAEHDTTIGSPASSVTSTKKHLSLLERVQRFKQREAEKGR